MRVGAHVTAYFAIISTFLIVQCGLISPGARRRKLEIEKCGRKTEWLKRKKRKDGVNEEDGRVTFSEATVLLKHWRMMNENGMNGNMMKRVEH